MRSLKLPVIFLTVFWLVGCETMDELQVNPNEATQAPPASLFTGLLLDIKQDPWNETQRYNQFYCINEPYYGNQSYRWTSTSLRYGSLRNTVKMEAEARRLLGDQPNPYVPLAKFLRAWFFVDMTQRVGDIPMSQALQASEDVLEPAYDTQKDVYRQSLQLLEEANAELAAVLSQDATLSVDGDIYFNGDLAKWQKVINSFRLRVLMSLSRKADDPDLGVKEQFAAIFNDPVTYPIISSNEDNLQVEWISNRTNKYPIFSEGGDPSAFKQRNPISATYLDILIANRDPRIFVVASPTDSARDSGNPDYVTAFTSFRGANPGATQADIFNLSAAGKLSSINENYFYRATGEPTIQLGWAETEFTIAEAILRGWISGEAATHYENGIRASMLHYGITAEQTEALLAQPAVLYAGMNETGLTQILTQKYVAFFQNSGWQAFYEQRRTGVPAFAVGPGNENGQRIPKRWMYPVEEYQANTSSVNEAITRQFGGADDINLELWLIKP